MPALLHSCMLIPLAGVLLVHAITMSIYSNLECTGAPISTSTYTAGQCNLGGLVYSCSSGHQCLRIRTFSANGSTVSDAEGEGEGKGKGKDVDSTCGGSVTSTTLMPCDICNGGSDTTVSTYTGGCSTDHPAIYTCFGSGWCNSGCQTPDQNLTVGCVINATTGVGVDVDIISCDAIMMDDYADYNSCSGTINSQSVFAAGHCNDGMLWQC
jgi:hypothetical protein